MIISASRRTDIPAFFSEWFYNRVNEGYLMVRNPMNCHQVSKININPDAVECIVFWTKNPAAMLDKLNLLNDYNYYFQYTINPYDIAIEPGVPRKKFVIDTFIKLSKMIGRERVIWRYDPIIVSKNISESYHYEYFECLSSILASYTDKCIISFLDMYRKTERNTKHLNVKTLNNEEIRRIAGRISNIAKKYNLSVESCAEGIDLSDVGIKHGKCIDDDLISRIIGANLNMHKDKNQRAACRCVSSVDIGAYNTCMHKCSYCYANFSINAVRDNFAKHNPSSPLLIGKLREDDKVFKRSFEQTQVSIFDDYRD